MVTTHPRPGADADVGADADLDTDRGVVDERLTTLELKLMDVERTVEALDAVILRQARDIETLRAERARLEARVESLAEGLGDVPSADDERPPHY